MDGLPQRGHEQTVADNLAKPQPQSAAGKDTAQGKQESALAKGRLA